MSAIGASETRDLWALVGGVGAVTLALGWWTARDAARPGRIVAECADGSVIGDWREHVRRRAGRSREQRARLATRFPGRSAAELRRLASDELARGDLCSARIREGEAGEAAWVVEGLDRAHARLTVRWEFETVDAGLTALRLLEARIVVAGVGEAGGPRPAGEREFDEVRDRERSVEGPRGGDSADARS